jgi:hypothetical protein
MYGTTLVPWPTANCGEVGTVMTGKLHEERVMASRYGPKAKQKVARAMHERKEGTLKSGRSGKRVTSRKQAIAIGLSEARKAGGKVPRKSSSSRTSASRSRKSTAKRKSSR